MRYCILESIHFDLNRCPIPKSKNGIIAVRKLVDENNNCPQQ